MLPPASMPQELSRGSQRSEMKKNFSLAMLIALLLGFGLVSTSHGKASRQSTQSTDQSKTYSTATKKKKKKPAADTTDPAKSPQANAGETSGTSPKTTSKKKPNWNEAAGT